MASIFTRIIQNELPAHKIAETERFLAFLDIKPLTLGHTLVIPKVEVDYLFDLEEETYIGLHLFARFIAVALRQVVPCERIATAVIGLEVPHAHLHLVPIRAVSDLDFNRPRLEPTPEELTALAEKIRQAL